MEWSKGRGEGGRVERKEKREGEGSGWGGVERGKWREGEEEMGQEGNGLARPTVGTFRRIWVFTHKK